MKVPYAIIVIFRNPIHHILQEKCYVQFVSLQFCNLPRDYLSLDRSYISMRVLKLKRDGYIIGNIRQILISSLDTSIMFCSRSFSSCVLAFRSACMLSGTSLV